MGYVKDKDIMAVTVIPEVGAIKKSCGRVG